MLSIIIPLRSQNRPKAARKARQQGVFDGKNKEGVVIKTTIAPVPSWDWNVAIGVPTETLSQPSGPVTLAFRPDHGITDRAVVPHAFAGGSWSVTVDPHVALASVLLNEFLADNKRGLRDVDGDRNDWLELFNQGDTTVSLAGWTLSDDPKLPGKWTLPAITIKPKGYLVIFASGKNRTDPAAELHANFKLSKDAGSFLGLFDAGGEIGRAHV